MLGALLGDIAGSRLEFVENRKRPEKLCTPLDFATDDSILTLAVYKALKAYKDDPRRVSLESRVLFETLKSVFRYPGAGWGNRFYHWCGMTADQNGLEAGDFKGWMGRTCRYPLREQPKRRERRGHEGRLNSLPFFFP